MIDRRFGLRQRLDLRLLAAVSLGGCRSRSLAGFRRGYIRLLARSGVVFRLGRLMRRPPQLGISGLALLGVRLTLRQRFVWLGFLGRNAGVFGFRLLPATLWRGANRRPPGSTEHIGRKRGRLVAIGRVMLAQEVGESRAALAMRKPMRGLVALRAGAGKDLRRRFALIQIGLGVRQHGSQRSQQANYRRKITDHPLTP